jgi:hypothetical protein
LPAEYPHQTGTINEVEMRTLYIRADAVPAHAPVMPQCCPSLRSCVSSRCD